MASQKTPRCPGCKHCEHGVVPPDAAPDFKTQAALEAFWARHTVGAGPAPKFTLSRQGQHQLEAIRERLGQKKLRVTMLMDPWLKAGLEELAESVGVGYQTLAHIYLAQRVQREFKNAATTKRRPGRSSQPRT